MRLDLLEDIRAYLRMRNTLSQKEQILLLPEDVVCALNGDGDKSAFAGVYECFQRRPSQSGENADTLEANGVDSILSDALITHRQGRHPHEFRQSGRQIRSWGYTAAPLSTDGNGAFRMYPW